MRIPLDQIHIPGLDVSGGTADAWVQNAAKTVRGTPGEPTQDPHEEEGPESAEVTLKLKRFDQQVHVTGRMAITLLCACDRCGTSTRVEIGGEIDQLYKAPESDGYEPDYDLAESELDVGWHDGQAIDLEAVLTEALALQGPDRVRCDDEGVFRIDKDGRCELPATALEGGPSRPNPFAALKLP